MRGTAFALIALTFAATTPHPVAAQCYGPECDRQRSDTRRYYSEPPDFRSVPPQGQTYRSGAHNQPQPYRPTQHEQARPYQQARPYEQAQPYGPPPYEQRQPYQPTSQAQPAYQQPTYQQPAYQQPSYQPQPRPPVTYSNVPPGMPPRGYDQRSTRPDSHETTTRVTKISKPKKAAVHPNQPGPAGRTVARTAPPQAGPGQVTISVAEYRDLQNQARELQRLRGMRSGAPHTGSLNNGAPNSGGPNNGSPFPDVPPPPPGQPPGPGKGF